MFRAGDLVRWKPECAQSERELAQVFSVAEPADNGRCYIKPAFWDRGRDGVCCPAMLVKDEWLEPVQERR